MIGRSDHRHLVPVDRVAAKEVLHLLSNLGGGRREGGGGREGRRKEKREEERRGLSDEKRAKSEVLIHLPLK